MRSVLSFLPVVIALTLGITVGHADTLHVDPNDAGAYATIQEAIDASSPGDSIIVRSGIYTGPGNKNLNLGGKAITLRSEHGPISCIIELEGNGRGFSFSSNETDTTVIDGFTVQNGGNVEGGGAVSCFYGSPLIRNCILRNNTATRIGGAVHCNNASPKILNCIISDNIVLVDSQGQDGYGGGIGCWWDSYPEIIDCIISGNSSARQGGGIYILNASPQINNCIIRQNTAGTEGGGISCGLSGGGSCYATVINCEISENAASSGGGVYTVHGNSKPELVNCLIRNNTAVTGAAFCSNWSLPVLINCTIVNNAADQYGGGILSWQDPPDVYNCIIWSNTPDSIYATGSGVNTSYCDIQWGYAGTNNIDSDPLFADANQNDYHITTDSPCVNKGNNTPVAGQTSDKDGEPRITYNTVDMGAYEYGPVVYHIPSEYTVIQEAMDAAGSGDTVLVADGRYTESLLFRGKTLNVRSMNGPQNCILYLQEGMRDIRFAGDQKSGTVFDGFTVTGCYKNWVHYSTITCTQDSSPTIANCIIRDNIHTAGAGGIVCDQSSPTIVNCSIFGNVGYRGSGILAYYGNPVVTNCTIADNIAYSEESYTGQQGSGVVSVYGSPKITNSIIWDNDLYQILSTGSPSPVVTYSDVQGGYGGNMNSDPQFIDPSTGDYRLSDTSPCLDSGDNTASGIMQTDADGYTRFANGITDIGAYEYSRVLRVPAEYPDIQQAIDFAVYGDTILVADGAYPGGIDFQGKAITVRSENGPRNCVIDCNGVGRGCIFQNEETSGSVLDGLTICNGQADLGGAIYCGDNSAPTITNCVIRGNSALTGGGLYFEKACTAVISNCLVTTNEAQKGGGIACGYLSSPNIIHCTIVDNNSLGDAGGGVSCEYARPTIMNSIIRGNIPEQILAGSYSAANILSSNVEQGNISGAGNINEDPLFVYPAGGDYHLQEGSPCIDAGFDDSVDIPSKDQDGRHRFHFGAADIGAYEFGSSTLHVPEDYSTIQAAIDAAAYGDTVLVAPGTYSECLDFMGKSITVKAEAGPEPSIIQCKDGLPGVLFTHGEDRNAVLNGFAIIDANSLDGGAVLCVNNSSPTIVNCLLRGNTAEYGAGICSLSSSPHILNCTIVNNTSTIAGGAVYCSGPEIPTLTNCILWANQPQQIYGDGQSPQVSHCDIQQSGFPGNGNIQSDPLFVNEAAGDFSLSQQSPCIDAGFDNILGLPDTDIAGNERIRRSHVDMGAFEVFGIDIYVPGPSQPQDIMHNIKNAVESAYDGDTVIIADGVYRGLIDFQGKAITVRSENGPENCVIDGFTWDRAFIFSNAEGPDSAVSGFTIRNCRPWQKDGGAVYCSGSSPTISECVFSGNQARNAKGGAIFCTNGAAPLITHCAISGGSQTSYGGGICCGNLSTPTITHCRITNNSAYNGGGGIAVIESAAPVIVNCVIASNSSQSDGGGVFGDHSPLTLINCTIIWNHAMSYGGGVMGWFCDKTVANNIVWGNSGSSDPEWLLWGGVTILNSNNHVGGADPLFINPNIGDYRLLEGSPCINTGTNNAPHIPDVDLDGQPRIIYDVIDKGADEVQFRPVVPAQLGVTILPQQAAQEGAQWRIADGTWRDSEYVEADLAAGYYEIEFKSIPGWLAPVNQSLRLSGDDLTEITVEYKSTHYTIGQIPSFEVKHADGLSYQVRADNLTGNIVYDYRVDGDVAGTVSLDPTSGVFSYEPNSHDTTTFSVTIWAQSENDSVHQTVEITPVPDLLAEFNLFDEPTQPLPDPESTDYIIKELLENPAELFNTVVRSTRTINVLGKDVVIQSGHENDLYVYHGNEDIKEMNIFADTVIVRSPWYLPQTHVTIYARSLRFEGSSACINTTPKSWETSPQDIGSDGEHGIKGGTITLNIESIYSEGDLGSRLILHGGDGQQPGPGQDGADGQSFTPLSSCGSCPILWPNTVEVYSHNVCQCVSSGYVGYLDPMKGENATPAGIPGNGGEGGNTESNLDISIFVDNSGGHANPSTPELLHQLFDAEGGAPGNPHPAFSQYFSSGTWHISTVSRAGYDAPAPEPDYWQGPDGHFYRVGHSLSWIHPKALKMIVSYAKDLYLYQYVEESRDIFERYLAPLDQLIDGDQWNQLPEKWQQELRQLRDEILTYVHQIQNGQDFFGNPPGWVPMLSFEITKEAYEREVDRAIQVLYLSHWLENVMGDAEKEAQALTTARNTMKEEIDDFKQQYTAAVNLVPALKTESQEITVKISALMQSLENKEKELLARAEQNVKDRHKVPDWKKALRVIGSTLRMTPMMAQVSAPRTAVAGFGALMSSVTEEFLSDEAWPTIVNQSDINKQFNSIDFDAAMENWMTDSEVAITGRDEAELQSYLQNLNDCAGQIASGLTQIKDTLKETHVSNKEVEAELIKIKQRDPEFNQLIDDVVEVMARKQLFARQLAGTMQRVSSLSNNVRQNLLSIDAMNRRFGDVEIILDQRAKLYLQEMDKRARKRLVKYHYYLAKAYEYRLLQPYDGQLNLNPLFDRFVDITSVDGRLTQDDFDALRPILEDQLYTIADEILDLFIESRGGGELSTSFTFDLTSEEIQKLNEKESLTINLYERGLFLTTEEDIRIVNLEVENLQPLNPQSGCGVSYIKVYMAHSGLSRLSKDGQVYLFHHYREDPDGDSSVNKNVWGATFDHNNGNLIDPIQPSKASESLLRSVLGIADEHIMLYSRPSAWGDVVITTETNPGLCEDILIDTLTLRITYDYARRGGNQVVLDVTVSEEDLYPYFVVDTQDLNGRQDGVASFQRVYEKSVYGNKKVMITAPEMIGGWLFEKWTQRNGINLPAEYYTESLTQVLLPLDRHHAVRAQYTYCGTMARYGDMNVDEDIDLNDFAHLGRIWLKDANDDPIAIRKGDLDKNGVVDILDLEILALHWLE